MAAHFCHLGRLAPLCSTGPAYPVSGLEASLLLSDLSCFGFEAGDDAIQVCECELNCNM